jgi:hypothetical protein
LPSKKQRAAGARPNRNVAPGDLGVGQDAVDQRDGQREERPGAGKRGGPPEREVLGRGRGGQDLAERHDDRRDQQVGQQQRADATEVESQGKRFLLRSDLEGTSAAVFRAVGVVIPPSVQRVSD